MSEQNEQLRAEFEVWATGKGLALGMWGCRTQYTASWTQTAWEAFQAARRAQPAPTVQAEPVAWRYQRDTQARPGVGDGEWKFTAHGKEALELQGKAGYKANDSFHNWEPLYAAPAHASSDGRDAKDAARYRWLRDEHIGDDPDAINMRSAKRPGLDAAIDAALAGTGVKGGES